MHNLHFILIKADSAADAASETETLILNWGDENNWRRIGGVASEDGSDDIDNHDDGRWPLSFLDAAEGVPKEGTYFSRTVAYLNMEIAPPLTLPATPFSTHPDLRSAIAELSDMLRAFDLEGGDTHDLWCVRRNVKHLSELIASRRAREHDEGIPQFYDWEFDYFGLTDMTEQSEGARRYLVFLDMHS
jgi:hypothetical protein